MSGKRKRSFAIKPEGLALIQTRVTEKGYSYQKFAEVAGLSPDTIGNIFRGHNPERKTIEAIAQALKLEPTDIVDANEWYPKSSTTANHTDINWRLVCQAKLENQQASQRIRRKATEMGFEVNVDVPLGLVERKQQQRRSEKVERQVYELEKEVITKIYEHKEFLQQVIGQSQGRKNKHIAIVGEPGAGKTTLLSKIANFIQSQTEDLAICISLASLQGRTLQEYLLKTWLSEAMGLVYPEVVITPEIENQLITRFRKSGVWLLLDGVDEMDASSPVQALIKINRELTDWLAEARVVLTCRLNVWDVNVNNTLSGFDTFKTQEFQPEQIDEFIQEWFIRAEKPQRGEELQAKLKETRHERICELVTNPLRLALLCQTFYLEQGDLPATKAALYQRFTRYFYEWKQEFIPTDLINTDELKDELHQALGKLALAGINSAARFRLKESLARREMGEKLFKLACDVGWLNLVDRDAGTDEPVYAFFHPNYQEYFAALVVDDWDYFLNHNNENPNPFIKYNNKDCVYRIFEPQWKEVILQWLGREDVDQENKDEFIRALGDFKDGFGDYNFYYLQAYYLGFKCLEEFPDSKFNDAVQVGIDENEEPVYERRFDEEIDLPTDYFFFCDPIPSYVEMIKQLGITKNDSEALAKAISHLFRSQKWHQELNIFDYLMKTCEKCPKSEEEAIFILIEILKKNSVSSFRLAAIESLKKILREQQKFALVIEKLKNYIGNNSYIHKIIEHCAQNMTYSDFYRAWNGEPSSVQTLENQFTNTTVQLQPTNKTYPILINAQALQDETDTSACAQEICNQIYLTAFPDNPEIPEVNNAPQLKRILPQIKKQLQTKNLALIINNCEPNQALITFCRKLTDTLHIAWITHQPLEPPLRGFPPNQPNLLSAIQTWINEIE